MQIHCTPVNSIYDIILKSSSKICTVDCREIGYSFNLNINPLIDKNMIYAVINHGWEDHELVGLFTNKEAAIKCAESQELDDHLFNCTEVYKGKGTEVMMIYSRYTQS